MADTTATTTVETTDTTTVAEDITATTTQAAPATPAPKGGKAARIGTDLDIAEQRLDDARQTALGNHQAEHTNDGDEGRSTPAAVQQLGLYAVGILTSSA